VGLFNKKDTEHKLERLENQLTELKRQFESVLQEWDACQARVSKVLRRIARAEQARDGAERPEPGDGTQLPLTTVPVASDRMAKIREQLAQRGRT